MTALGRVERTGATHRIMREGRWAYFTVCHGKNDGEKCRADGMFKVTTEGAEHFYCREHLPLKYRPLVGLGTAI